MCPDNVSRCFQPAFPDLSPSARGVLDGYERLLNAVLPMKAAHRRRLPDNIQSLSTFLTTERHELLGRDYLHEPQTLGAYLWYFLPWNMLRLSRLLGGLDLNSALERPEGPVIVDLGAGPLTMAQALALARPDLLERRLHIYCLDSTPKPMREGRKLYFGLLDLLETPARWKIHLVHAPWQAGLRKVPQADILTAVNFMNELPWHRRDPLSEQVKDVFTAAVGHVRSSGQCLFMEPGNRLGGKLVSMLREAAVAHGWNVLAPCTHIQPCPMLGNPRETSWCHFSVSTRGCPDWLAGLSREAALGKRDLSLSFVHLAGSQGVRPAYAENRARIISNEFSLPSGRGLDQRGRYACASHGKVLLVSKQSETGTESGDVVDLLLGQEPQQDAKTETLMARLHPGPARPGPLSTGQVGTGMRSEQKRSDLDKPAKKWNKTPKRRGSKAQRGER